MLPLLGAIVLVLLFLAGVYLVPHRIDQDVGSERVSIDGLSGPERNERFSYAYTDGAASARLAQAGVGRFIASLRMGGPQEQIPVAARVATEAAAIDLGAVAPIRVYHLLIPADGNGDLEFRLPSATTTIDADPRRLGLLVDWMRVRPVGTVTPPPSLLLATPLILTLGWLTLSWLAIGYRAKLALLLLSSAVLAISYLASRGRVVLPVWWLIGGGVVALVATSFARFDGWRFSTPLRQITILFVVWRVALWLVSGVGLWYSSAFYELAKGRTLAGSVIDRQQLIWKALAGQWMQFDSGHYQAIATSGYSFYNQEWPNIAFFPLYPLLIRLLLPITGGRVAVAALLVSHIALFVALLLLYDLVARDFNPPVAYRAVVLLLVFPTSFFFVAGYTESLALALVIGAVWAMRRQRWYLAGIAGALLALTRLPGVLIAPILGLTFLQHHDWQWRALLRPAILAVLLPPLGLGLFMLFQWWRFGTPFAFLIAQERWGNEISPPWAIPQVLLQTIPTSVDWPMRAFQLVTWLSFAGLMLGALLRLPLAYGLTMLLLLTPPYLSNYHGSFPRYVLVGFPAFVVMALLAQRLWVRQALVTTMLLFLVVGVLLFVNGFWVG